MSKSAHLALYLLLACVPAAAGQPKAKGPGEPPPKPAPATTPQDPFEQLLLKVQSDPAGATEDQVRELLASALRLGRPYAASLAVKPWLARNPRAPHSLLSLAAETAFVAGDFRAASERLKACLSSGPPPEAASEAAATLYMVTADFLASPGELYQLMASQGERYRAGPAARKFDGWFLDAARARRDAAAAARWLALVLADATPLEQERLYFHDHLDWLMGEVVKGRPEHFAALPHCRKLLPLLRGDKARSLLYALHVANLEFKAGAAGRDKAALDKAFEPVAAAARACFDAAPTTRTLQDIVYAFTDGGLGEGFDQAAWGRQGQQKSEVFAHAFDKLSDAGRQAVLEWRLPRSGPIARHLASPQQWADLGARHGALFRRCDAVRHLPFVTRPASRELYRKQAEFLQGVPSPHAAVINSMAASDDILKAVEHLVRNESWHLSLGAAFELFENEMWPAWRALAEAEGKKPPEGLYQKALAHLGTELAKTPGALDRRSAEAFLEAAWELGAANDPNDKSPIIAQAAALQWVPYERRDRKEIFNKLQPRFRGWAEWVRREARTKGSNISPEIVKQIVPVEEALRQAADGDADPKKAPNPLCQAFASAVLADQGKNKAEFARHARALWPLVRESVGGASAPRAPFAQAALLFVLANRQDGLEKAEVQAEILADALARYDPAAPNPRIEELCEAAARVQGDRGFGRAPRQFRDRTLALNAVFEKAMLDLLAKGQFSPFVFQCFLGTRVGDGWSARDRGEAVMAAIIEKRALERTPWRPLPTMASAACAAQWLIRNEFPALNAKFPVERYFDDAFVEEANRTKQLDWHYWDCGLDEKRKVVNAAARILQGFDTLPFWNGAAGARYARNDFWNWQARALGAEPAIRDAMLARIEAAWGKTRFDSYAMGRGWFASAADPSTPQGRKDFFARLKAYTERASKAPERLPPPFLGQLGKLGDPKDLPRDELDALLALFPGCVPATWPDRWGFDLLATTLIQACVAQGRANELYPAVPHLWKMAKDTRSAQLAHDLTKFSAQLADAAAQAPGTTDLALVFASVGLDLLGVELPADARTNLTAIRSKALTAVGTVIPVGRDDRRFPLYEAQLAFLAGRTQNAWELYWPRRAVLLSMFKELDPAFCTWLINKDTDAGEFDAAEALARQMIQWFDSVADGFGAETRARLLLAYAGISLGRQEYPKARALFERIATAKEFEGTTAQAEADIRVAEVDRLTRRFDDAVQRLEKLTRHRDRVIQAESYYQWALVKFDQEEFREALEQLEQALIRVPDHALARILEGRTKVRLRKLEEPTEIQIGTPAARRYIIPGKPLKVNLEDRNLAIVGSSAHIEIRAWSEAGDEEHFILTPFGDSKTRFVGQIPTELAPVAKGDGKLQLLGNDVARYDFSEKFKKQHKIVLAEPQALVVATDAELAASSGKILSPEEREAMALEEVIRKRLKAAPGEEEPAEKKAALSTIRPANQIKPGNKFNIRVIDPDRSETAGRDKLAVRVATTSGDIIPAFPLEETGTHTGVFEGAVQTSAGRPTAYASDSEEGKDPNFAISAGDYPPWVGLPDLSAPKLFNIDLNDNVALGKMAIVANVPGRKLKKFFVQTSLNGRDFTTLGHWPGRYNPWDGTLAIELVKYGPVTGAPASLPDFLQYLDLGYLKHNTPKLAFAAKAFAPLWMPTLEAHAHTMGLADDGPGANYIAHLFGAFYQPVRKVRTFELDTKENPAGLRYILTVDGQPGDSPTRVRRSLAKGAHRVDIYVFASRKAQPAFELLADADEPPFMRPVPPEMFDIAKNPLAAEAVRTQPAAITAGQDNSLFEVAFPAGARARVVRLVIAEFETDAPAINRISLTDAAGTAVLPTKEDFMALRKNQVLEVVPGDRITVTYEDPRVVSEGRETHEATLTATFHNATLSACFVEYSGEGANRRARYIPMRRFKPGDKITVFINDPDCDTTDKPDTVKFTARTPDGKAIECPALETAEHSGIFIGAFFPVDTEPKRESELRVAPGDDITVAYLDRENTDPGIPWERTVLVEQTVWAPPLLAVYEVTSRPLTEEERAAEAPRPQAAAAPPRAGAEGREAQSEQEEVPPTRALLAVWPEKPQAADQPAPVFINGPVIVELRFPFIAQSPESAATLYVQTASGRKALGKPPEGDFDIRVPGTLKLEARPGNPPGAPPPPPGYKSVTVKPSPFAGDALEDGRFTFSVPVQLAKLPATSLATEEADASEKPVLAVKGDDELFFGFQYTEPAAGPDAPPATKWLTARAALQADAFFDATDSRFREPLASAYVGDTLYFRVIDPTRDTTDDKDAVAVELVTASGTAHKLELTETFTHSGVFKGSVRTIFRGDKAEAQAPNTLAVAYGDKVTAAYSRPDGKEKLEQAIEVHKGSDGGLVPFTKRFADPKIAVQTQFSIAEAYFELAKRHRELGQDDLARDGIAQGKKLLEEAIRDFPDTEARAQADYLLADLALEFANEAKEEETRKKHYLEAMTRFTDIVASYPESAYAPKAQYKKALVFEKMGLIDQACEEYVKLSYRYPDNELVAETIARLGQYFFAKGKDLRAQATPEMPPVEREKLEIQAREMHKTAGQVFGRLSVRFPNHRLAGRTLLLSGQCYMQAEDFPRAIETFKGLVANPKMEPDLIAEAMYWCGDTYLKQKDSVNAYRMLKRLTWDYPASKWAKFARGRLTEDDLVRAGEADEKKKAKKE